MRTIPMPGRVKEVVDEWLVAAGITSGKPFRRVNKAARIWGDRATAKVVWLFVHKFATKAGIDKLAPHGCRRTCARLPRSGRVTLLYRPKRGN
jgi:integrase